MNKVCIMNLENGDDMFRFLKEMELSRVPVVGEKVFIEDVKNGQTTSYVYKVVDVQFGDDEFTDVFVVNIGTQEDYWRTLVSMHTAK
jgi:hypothetical protein